MAGADKNEGEVGGGTPRERDFLGKLSWWWYSQCWEVIVDDLSLFGGAQLAVDATMVSPVRAVGLPREARVQVHQNHFHQKKIFIKNHFHQKPFSSKTIFIKNHFHQNHFHQKPLSSKTTFIKNHFHQKPFSSKTIFI